MLPSREVTYPLPRALLKMIFLFPPVAYVGSLEGSLPVIPVDTRYFEYDTVDGSEIRRSRVEVDSLCHYLQGFSTIPGGCLGFLNRGR